VLAFKGSLVDKLWRNVLIAGYQTVEKEEWFILFIHIFLDPEI
jgi:hypothetical protein